MAFLERWGLGQLAMPSAESKNTADFRAEFWGVSLDGIAGTLGFRMCRRTSLMYVTLTGAVLGVACRAWNSAFCFRREALCCLRHFPRRSYTSCAASDSSDW